MICRPLWLASLAVSSSLPLSCGLCFSSYIVLLSSVIFRLLLCFFLLTHPSSLSYLSFPPSVSVNSSLCLLLFFFLSLSLFTLSSPPTVTDLHHLPLLLSFSLSCTPPCFYLYYVFCIHTLQWMLLLCFLFLLSPAALPTGLRSLSIFSSFSLFVCTPLSLHCVLLYLHLLFTCFLLLSSPQSPVPWHMISFCILLSLFFRIRLSFVISRPPLLIFVLPLLPPGFVHTNDNNN